MVSKSKLSLGLVQISIGIMAFKIGSLEIGE